MRPGLSFATAARQDLRRIGAWFQQPGAGDAARRRLARIAATIETLVDYPNRGRSLGTGPFRIATTERHRIVYAATHSAAGNTVVILRILGPGQNY